MPSAMYMRIFFLLLLPTVSPRFFVRAACIAARMVLAANVNMQIQTLTSCATSSTWRAEALFEKNYNVILEYRGELMNMTGSKHSRQHYEAVLA